MPSNSDHEGDDGPGHRNLAYDRVTSIIDPAMRFVPNRGGRDMRRSDYVPSAISRDFTRRTASKGSVVYG